MPLTRGVYKIHTLKCVSVTELKGEAEDTQ